MTENSPALQRWVVASENPQVPKGRPILQPVSYLISPEISVPPAAKPVTGQDCQIAAGGKAARTSG